MISSSEDWELYIDVLFHLGDFENDNPEFTRKGVSIGIRSYWNNHKVKLPEH
jgi:hypothetical protein